MLTVLDCGQPELQVVAESLGDSGRRPVSGAIYVTFILHKMYVRRFPVNGAVVATLLREV